MPIIKCPKCRKRYDAGVDEDLEDLPEDISLKVVCPACGQWLRLPERETTPPPNLPAAMLREMKAQSRLVDDEEDQPSRRSRRNNDDDGRPSRARPSRRRVEEEEERPRRKPKPAKKSKTGLIIGLVIGGVVLVGCCGVGGVLFYLYGPLANTLTVTSGTRQMSPTGGTQYVQINWKSKGSIPAGYEVVGVASAGGQTSRSVPLHGFIGEGTGHVGWTPSELRSTPGPVEVWMEQRPVGSKGVGKKVSNSFTIP